MFKNKEKAKDFAKRQLAFLLAIVMLFGCFASTGATMQTAHAEVAVKNDHAAGFIEQLVQMTESGTPYVWGGWQNSGVDCRGFVRKSLERAYGLDIFFTAGYIVDENGNPILDANGNRRYIDVAAYSAAESWRGLDGQRICVESADGTLRTYYRVLCAGKCYEYANTRDIPFAGTRYSSLIAYACKFPGSIISHNGHYGVGLGEFHSKEEFLSHPIYSRLDRYCSGNTADNYGGQVTRWSQAAYNLGNSYPEDDMRYWFGKTMFLSACSPSSGIRADNFTTVGKSEVLTSSSNIAILVCESVDPVTEVRFTKIDSNTGAAVADAVYGIYKDAACTELVDKFDTTATGYEITLPHGTYYLKEMYAPYGYYLSPEIRKIEVSGETLMEIVLEDAPVDATLMVQKVDASDISKSLPQSQLELLEHNGVDYQKVANLEYDPAAKAFILPASYKNVEGETITDRAVHYNQTNCGMFAVQEVAAQSGYSNDGYFEEFNIVEKPIVLVGKNAITNNPIMSLQITKEGLSGEKLTGATFRFFYNEQEYAVTELGNGLYQTEAFTYVSGVDFGTIYETNPPAGYQISPRYQNGLDVYLTTSSADGASLKNGVFVNTHTVINAPEGVTIDVADGRIEIFKFDKSRIEFVNGAFVQHGVADTYYSVFTDAKCTQTATDKFGTPLTRLKTNSDGEIIINSVPIGVYYIKEVEAPENYAIQHKVFQAVISENRVDANGVAYARPQGIADARQTVTLRMAKFTTLANGTKMPVANAVYALYNATDLITFNGKTVKPQVLGYYMTDATGAIEATVLGATVPGVEGCDTVTIKATDGSTIPGEALVNGLYYFKEVQAPENYTLDPQKHYVYAEHQLNDTTESHPFTADLTNSDIDGIDLSNGCVVDGEVSSGGDSLTMNYVVVDQIRQNVVINFTKQDSAKPLIGPSAHYNLSKYDQAVASGLAATLEGAEYQLWSNEDMIDIASGTIIPKDTLLGVYRTDANGKFTITTMTVGAYKNKQLPNGSYYLIESVAPVGYALNSTKTVVVASWSDQTKDTITVDAVHKDDILKHSIHLTKVAGHDDTITLQNATFQLYSVATLIEYGINISDYEIADSSLFFGRKAIDGEALYDKIIEKIVPMATDVYGNPAEFHTDAYGEFTTNEFVYGDYVLIETEAPPGYKAGYARYIKLPWVMEAVADDITYVHNVAEQPTADLEITAVNHSLTDKSVVELIVYKTDKEAGYPIITSQATFTLTNEVTGDKILTASNSTLWITDSTGQFNVAKLPVGTYKLHEEVAPTGYIAGKDIIITITENSIKAAYEDGTAVETVMTQDAYGKMIMKVMAPNKTKPTPISYTVAKNWIDNNNIAGERPEFILVQLLANNIPYGNAVELSPVNGWSYTWNNLDTEDANGTITYTVAETTQIPNYSVSYDQANHIITNTYIPPKISETVEKIWEDDNNAAGARPESITVQLLRDGVPHGAPVELSDATQWKATWDNLDSRAEDGHLYNYTVEEISDIPNYTASYEGLIITNTYEAPIIPTTTHSIEKVWRGDEEALQQRPSAVFVQLLLNDSPYGDPVELNEANSWKHTWTELPLEINGLPANYTVAEISTIPNYVTTYEDGKIVNTYVPPVEPEKTSYIVNKIWHDNNDAAGKRPTEVEVQLYAGENPCGAPVILNEANGWKYEWHDLDVQMNGQDVVYSVKENTVINGYTTEYSGNNIINTYVIPKTTHTVVKVWKNDETAVDARPSSITVQLQANGRDCGEPVELTETGSWTYTWTDLDAEENGEPITYTVVELTEVPNYTTIYADNQIINTYDAPIVIPTFQVIATKVEIVEQEKKAVPGATMQLLDEQGNVVILEDGTVCEWVTSEDSFDKDPNGISGHLIDGLKAGTYFLHEVSAPDGYATSEDVKFVIEPTQVGVKPVEMIEHPIKVVISKVDAANNDILLAGAKLQLLNEDGTPVLDTNNEALIWDTLDVPMLITHLPVGKYQISELSAPVGYQKLTKNIEFEVVDTNEEQEVVVENKRTYGAIEIHKYDKTTGDALANVKFHLVVKSDVYDNTSVDPILYKDQVIATLTTDEEGYAKTENLVAFGYDEHGNITPVEYVLVEVQTPVGEQYVQNMVTPVSFAYDPAVQGIILVSLNLTNSRPIVEVHKNGSAPTFVGKYEDRNNVTVVGQGETIKYTITVTNSGAASAHNVVIKDKVPTNTLLSKKPTGHNFQEAEDGTLYWTIDELIPGQPVVLEFEVVVATDKASEIVNTAYYTMPSEIPTKPEDYIDVTDPNVDWKETETVVHQTVSLIKSSTVEGGTTITNATPVAVGSTIHYTIEFNAMNAVKNVVVSDAIPAGLKYVTGSAKINGVVDASASLRPDTNVLTFSSVNSNGATLKFEFDVTVEDIELNADMPPFVNMAFASYNINDSETDEITSNVVTHKVDKKLTVEKHAEVKTYEGDAAQSHNETPLTVGEEIEYTIVVRNDGKSDITDVVVADTAPVGTTLLSHEKVEGVTIWENKDTQTIKWHIESLGANESVTLKFKVVVAEQKAQLIINTAHYWTDANVTTEEPKMPEKTFETNDTVHQVVEFHKSSEIIGGKDSTDAKPVAIGDTIIYTLQLINRGDLNNAVITDKIPDGLTFVPNSIQMKREGDQEWTNVADKDGYQNNNDTVVMRFAAIEPGVTYIRFSVTVDHIKINEEMSFINKATIEYDKLTDKRETLESETVSHVTMVKVEGHKDGSDTYVGDYDAKNHVTVVEDGQVLTYTISISNIGTSDLKGVVIRDKLPEHTIFESADKDGKLNEDGYVTWTVDIPAGKTEVVTLKVICNSEGKAVEIVNQAEYAVPQDKSDIKDDEWVKTESVVHQTVAINKTASIKHGTTDKDALYVPIGSTFTYKIEFTATNDVYGVSVLDAIPAGLTFIVDSAKITKPDGTVVEVHDLKVDENNRLQFPAIDVNAGTYTFSFDVKVEDVKEYDTDYFFINTATVSVKPNEGVENKDIVMESNATSNKAIKTNKTDTPTLGLDTTSASTLWLTIAGLAMLATAGMIVYMIFDQKKKFK